MVRFHVRRRIASLIAINNSFDPDEKSGGFAHGSDPFLTSHEGVNIYGISKRPAIPVQPQVHILGRGEVPPNHYHFPPGFEIQGVDHAEFHLPPHIPAEEREKGASRFYQWHWDGSLYDIPPPRVGCLLAVRTPKGPDVTVRWDDGTGREMKIAPGSTAMVAGSRALALLDEEMQQTVKHSRIEYAPHAFKWMSTARSTRLGHLLETEGKEVPLEQLPTWEESKLAVYPMCWTNPKTGEVSLQVHGQGARKLYLKSSADEEEKVIDDLKEVRAFMDKIMSPVLSPENIYAHNHQEQDVILWYNRALWHSIVSAIAPSHRIPGVTTNEGFFRQSFQSATVLALCTNATSLLLTILADKETAVGTHIMKFTTGMKACRSADVLLLRVKFSINNEKVKRSAIQRLCKSCICEYSDSLCEALRMPNMSKVI